MVGLSEITKENFENVIRLNVAKNQVPFEVYDDHQFCSLEDYQKQPYTHQSYTNNRPMRPLGYLSPIKF